MSESDLGSPTGFQLGDCVRLRCGGPIMVIAETGLASFGHGGHEVSCQWHDLDHHLQSARLRVEVLRHEPPQEP